jgi:hypothetical protein
MKVNVKVASKVRSSEGRACNREGEGSMDSRSLTDTVIKRVTLPLVPSKEPGTLDLKDFNFDDLLAWCQYLDRSHFQPSRSPSNSYRMAPGWRP